MSSIELPELEKKVTPKCNFLWSQKILNISERLLKLCENKEILEFFKECEVKVRKLDKESKIAYNTEIQKFGGDEFGYLWFFYSDFLDTPVKMALKIEVFEKTIIVGKMDIPSNKETKKIAKHLNTPELSQNGEVNKNG